MNRKRLEYERKKYKQKNGCVHHWIIDPPYEMESEGVCKKCGAKRWFSNNSLIDFRDSLSLSTKRQMGNSKREA